MRVGASQQITQLIDLAVQKKAIRSDSNIPEAMKAGLVAKLDEQSAPVQQKMEAEQTKKTAKALVDKAQQTGDAAKSTSSNDGTDQAANSAEPASVPEAAPVAPSSEATVGQNVDDYA